MNSLIVVQHNDNIVNDTFTHRGRETHKCVSKLYQYWFRKWLGACPAPSYYQNQCSLVVKRSLRNITFNNILIKLQQFSFKTVNWKCRPQRQPYCLGLVGFMQHLNHGRMSPEYKTILYSSRSIAIGLLSDGLVRSSQQVITQIISVMSHERHVVLNHFTAFISLFRLTTKETSKFHTTGPFLFIHVLCTM